MERVNRLAASTSPYLLQHADNPVDWWPWGDEALAEAGRRDVPILLSVGYAACHWCHVMAHESFEDEAVAAVINSRFVAIKVDREERPDIDAIYMAATTAMTGHGGWPMTCLLTPSGEPFFCGTYFPKPNFLQLLDSATEAWTGRRAELEAASGRIVDALRTAMESDTVPAVLGEAELNEAVARLQRSFDEANGGYGSEPKFPPSMVLEFLLREHGRTESPDALRMAIRTCEAMARGGMYDQLAGGFARYSVDARWTVPHFEKMLYDNAQLLRVYCHLWRATRLPLAERVARETAEFLLRDLATAESGFASALDADTNGVEGLTYAWTPAQLSELLGDEDGIRAAELLSVTGPGTFELGTSTLQLPTDPDDLHWWQAIRQRLFEERNRRPQPSRDDKVITAWNGLAIAALAESGVLLDEPEYLAAAVRCAEFLLDIHWVSGRLHRSSRAGVVSAALGVAEDYGDLAEGLLVLHQATGQARWLTAAGELLEVALAHFAAPDGGFFDTADDAERLFTRPREQGDNAAPAGQSALAGALLSYSALAGSSRHRQAADAALAAAGQLAVREPRFAGWTLAIAEAALAGPLQVAVVGAGELADNLLTTARHSTSPGLVLVAGAPDAPGVPLLADRPLLAGEPAAYVCRGFVCDRPVGTVGDLLQVLG
ncbi:MAG: thioredoxin domain-containing protein [Actinomycetota bacterium]|nr:thioredoxin domain-containing protein [Actinomycetota bacterium]